MFNQSLILTLGLLFSAVSAEASQWYEYRTHTAIQSRITFTTSRIAPNIGLPYGAVTVGILYVELFNTSSDCPVINLSADGRSFSISTQFDPAQQKCWGRLDDKTKGRVEISNGKSLENVDHFNYPLFLISGNDRAQYQLIVPNHSGSLVEYFRLSDSIK